MAFFVTNKLKGEVTAVTLNWLACLNVWWDHLYNKWIWCAFRRHTVCGGLWQVFWRHGTEYVHSTSWKPGFPASRNRAFCNRTILFAYQICVENLHLLVLPVQKYNLIDKCLCPFVSFENNLQLVQVIYMNICDVQHVLEWYFWLPPLVHTFTCSNRSVYDKFACWQNVKQQRNKNAPLAQFD